MNKNINFIITFFLCVSIGLFVLTGVKFEIFDYISRFENLPDLVDYLFTPFIESFDFLRNGSFFNYEATGDFWQDIGNFFKFIGDGFIGTFDLLYNTLMIIPRFIVYILKVIITFVPFFDNSILDNLFI